MEPIRLLIVDDHMVVRKGIQMLVNTEAGIQLVGEAKDGQEAVHLIESLQPNIILMDLVMPQVSGIEAIAKIKTDYPHIKIIVLTTFEDDEKINAAIDGGADGYLLKDADGEFLLQAIQAVHKGEMPLHPRVARYLFTGKSREADTPRNIHLTAREEEVLQLVAQGMSNKEVADKLSLSSGTVKIHVSNILGKLNVSSRTEAAVLATQLGLVSIEEELR